MVEDIEKGVEDMVEEVEDMMEVEQEDTVMLDMMVVEEVGDIRHKE